MDENEIDRRVLLCACDCLDLDPRSPMCPDIDTLARQSGTPRAKVRRLRRQAMDNYAAFKSGELRA